MNIKEFEALFNKDTKSWLVYLVLKDKKWHCRSCAYQHVKSEQIAGGSGIQGLQRGSARRLGMVIESRNAFCQNCQRKTRQDKWNGQFVPSVNLSTMPASFVERVLSLLDSRDVVERTRRPAGQLTIDHKLPMIRWNEKTSEEQTNYTNMSDSDIFAHFQLLKRSNGSVSHNLLKSRSCEKCYETGERGTPFGIKFFYAGNSQWTPKDKEDPQGCIGCGWYDFNLWRQCLNKHFDAQ